MKYSLLSCSSLVRPWLGFTLHYCHHEARAFGCFLAEFISTPQLDESLKKEKNKLVETASELDYRKDLVVLTLQ